MKYKDFPAALIADRTLGPRQVRGIASTGSEDRDGDIVDPAGADLSSFRQNPIVLACHNQAAPVGTAVVSASASLTRIANKPKPYVGRFAPYSENETPRNTKPAL